MKKLSCSMMKALLICFTVFMLAGCGKKEPTPGDVVGTWTCYDNSIHGNDVIYVINSNGTMSTSVDGKFTLESTYTVTDNTIRTVWRNPNGAIESCSWTFEITEDSLTLTASDGSVRTYYKQ